MGSEARKVVVRLLPPEITEEELKNTIQEVHRDRATWWSFSPGKRYKGEAKPSLNARCYIQFESPASAEEFITAYHGHTFVDGQGETFRAVACLAPYQKVPRRNQKDSREGTIQDDPIFKSFVEALQAKKEFEPPGNPRELIRPAEGEDTPLVQYIRQRAIERRTRWEKQRSKKWSYMESVPEEGKRSKWYCSECGTTKNLEEDPNARGTFYCTYCWEQWEAVEVAAQTKKKKKKKAKEEEEYGEPDETYKKEKKKKKDTGDYGGTSKDWPDEGYGVKEDTHGKKKKSKKHEEEETWDEEESSARRWRKKHGWEGEAGGGEAAGAARRWRKKSDDPYESTPGASGKHSSRDDWWEEETHKKKKKSSRSEAAEVEEASGGRRWKAKVPTESAASWEAEEQSSSRRGRKDKGDYEGGGAQWVPKSQKGW